MENILRDERGLCGELHRAFCRKFFLGFGDVSILTGVING